MQGYLLSFQLAVFTIRHSSYLLLSVMMVVISMMHMENYGGKTIIHTSWC